MYIPSLDMGEYDDYSRPPPGTGPRQTSRKRADQVSRIPRWIILHFIDIKLII